MVLTTTSASTTATDNPAFLAEIAAASPHGPPPITRTSSTRGLLNCYRRNPTERSPLHHEISLIRNDRNNRNRKLFHRSRSGIYNHPRFTQIELRIVTCPPLTGLLVYDKLGSISVRNSPQRVHARGKLQSRKRNVLRCAELRRSVCACAPHAIIRNDVAEEHAPAHEWATVVDHEIRVPDNRTCCIANTERCDRTFPLYRSES